VLPRRLESAFRIDPDEAPNCPGADRMTPTEYEKAVVEFFRTDWPPSRYVVKHNIPLRGRKSRTSRQIDVSVFAAGAPTPFLIAKAKRHGRKIDVGKAGSLIALVQDIGGVSTVMISTSGFSGAALNHLSSEGIGDADTPLMQPIRVLRPISPRPRADNKHEPDHHRHFGPKEHDAVRAHAQRWGARQDGPH
jgi:hypothetical protein